MKYTLHFNQEEAIFMEELLSSLADSVGWFSVPDCDGRGEIWKLSEEGREMLMNIISSLFTQIYLKSDVDEGFRIRQTKLELIDKFFKTFE